MNADASVNAESAVVGFGSLWIPFYAAPHGWLIRVDLATRRVTARIPVGESPDSVAIAGNDVWVANTIGDGSRRYADENTLSRIDPARNHVVQRVRVEIGGPIAGGFGAVWVPDFQGGDGNGTLRKVDATSGRVVAALPLPGRPAVGCGRLWTIEPVIGVNTPEVTIVSAVNPKTGRRVADWPVIAPGITDPEEVNGDCLTMHTSQDDPATTVVGLVGPDEGIIKNWAPIGSRARLIDGTFWAVRDDGAYQPVDRDGRPLGVPITLPPVATQNGDAWFTVVGNEGWAITNRAAFSIGSVLAASAP